MFLLAIASPSNFISCKDFTNQKYNHRQIKKFCKSYERNLLTDTQIWFLYYQSKYFGINPLVALAKMEAETGLVTNPEGTNRYEWKLDRAFGYGRSIWREVGGKRYHRYSFYEIQTYFAIRTLRKWFDKWEPGKRIFIKCRDLKVEPVNAASYSLLIYCPFYYKHSRYGYLSMGNMGFEKIFKRFKKKIGNIND